MPRIRSVHPGLFTDGEFVGLSDAAQIFFIGLWTEADDFGAFEWKPVTLKIKLRGASTSPVEPLLEELAAADRIRQYEHDGRQYGVIRNFCRFQRPKFPKSQHFIPDDLRRFAGSTPPITEIDGVDAPPVPRKAEKSPQMEDGGGSRSSVPNGTAQVGSPNWPDDPVKTMFDTGVRVLTKRGVSERQARSVLGKHRGELKDDGRLLSILLSLERENPIEPLAYLTRAVAKKAGAAGGYVPMHPGAGG